MAGAIVLTAALAGGGLWYTQQYAYYATLPADTALTLVPATGGGPLPVAVSDFQGIDATSSPIRFRACFTLAPDAKAQVQAAKPYDKAEPLIAPRWFSCFDAKTISLALQRGTAHAYLSQHDIAPGVDRVIAVLPDGHAYAWQQLDPAVPVDTSIEE